MKPILTEVQFGLTALAISIAGWVIYKLMIRHRVLNDEDTMENPLCKKNALRYQQCPCGSGKQVYVCHGKKKKLSIKEYNEIIRIGKKWSKAQKKKLQRQGYQL